MPPPRVSARAPVAAPAVAAAPARAVARERAPAGTVVPEGTLRGVAPRQVPVRRERVVTVVRHPRAPGPLAAPAVAAAPLQARARHPRDERPAVVVAADGALRERLPPELGAP